MERAPSRFRPTRLSKFFVADNPMISRKTQSKIMKVVAVFMIFATVLFLVGPFLGGI